MTEGNDPVKKLLLVTPYDEWIRKSYGIVYR